jgi:hypothetical protein
MSTGFNLFKYGMVMPAPFFIFTAIHYITNSTEAKKHLSPYLPEVWNLESKLILLSMVAFGCSIFIILNIWAIMTSRLVLLANPLVNDEKPFVKFLNRVLSNSVEQFVIFIPVLCFWTLKYCKEDQKHLVLLHGLIWIVGRILFLLGYSLSQFNLDLAVCRSFGLFTTIGSTAFLVKRVTFDIYF